MKKWAIRYVPLKHKDPLPISCWRQGIEDATVNVRRYGSKETAVEDLNIFIDAMEAEVKNYSREN